MGTLTRSLQVSCDQLRERDAEGSSLALFAALSMLPAGAFAVDLAAIFGPGWLEPMQNVVRASLATRRMFCPPRPGVMARFSRPFPRGVAPSTVAGLPATGLFRPAGAACFVTKPTAAERAAQSEGYHYSQFPFVTSFAEQMLKESSWNEIFDEMEPRRSGGSAAARTIAL